MEGMAALSLPFYSNHHVLHQVDLMLFELIYLMTDDWSFLKNSKWLQYSSFIEYSTELLLSPSYSYTHDKSIRHRVPYPVAQVATNCTAYHTYTAFMGWDWTFGGLSPHESPRQLGGTFRIQIWQYKPLYPIFVPSQCPISAHIRSIFAILRVPMVWLSWGLPP